jgi:putative endonuclease
MKRFKNTVETGRWAEQLAATYLRAQGVQVVAQNYRCREGEIDLVGLHQTTLIFVEVRYRHHDYFGTGAESIDSRKQQRIILTAQHFLQQHPQWQESNCRFDAVIVSPSGAHAEMQWITDAFEAG